MPAQIEQVQDKGEYLSTGETFDKWKFNTLSFSWWTIVFYSINLSCNAYINNL
jgi:hypothetical protein